MKKTICMGLAALLVAGLLAGCGDKDGAATEALDVRDFGVYQAGEEVMSAEGYSGGILDFGNEAQYGLPEGEYTTRRGIAVGSTADELAEAYAGLECEIMTASETAEDGDYTWSDYAGYREQMGDKGTVAITYSLYFVEGERMTWTQFYQYAEGGEHNGEGAELADAQGYSLVFIVKGGAVSRISLSFIDYNNL